MESIMDLGTHAIQPSQSVANVPPVELVASNYPGTETCTQKKKSTAVEVARHPDSLIDETWVPMTALLDAMQEAISGVDEYLCVKYWNTPMARLTGVAREEALQQPLFSLLPSDFERHLGASLRQLFHQQPTGNDTDHGQNTGIVEGKFSQRHDNSKFLDFSYRMRRLPTAGNHGLAIISLQPVVESRRQPHRQKQQEQLGLLGKLSASLVHELTEPLDTICSRIDNIITLSGNNWNKRLEGELHSIITEVYRISYLINNIITLSSNDASTLMQVDINHRISEAITLLEHTLNRKIACTMALQDGLPPVKGDPILLLTAFQNLLRYAVEAAGEDAVPKIQTGLVPLSQPANLPAPGSARLNASQQLPAKENPPTPQHIVIKIEDRSKTTKPPVLADLFEPLSNNKPFGLAVSLGLFISKKIIESHRGQIKVSNEPGRGTIFTIALNV